MLRGLLRPRTILPGILAVALVAGLLAVSDPSHVLARIAAIHPAALALFFALMMGYEAVRCLQWHVWLRALALPVPPRTQIFTFLAGEAAQPLPAGNYLRNYLLRQTTGAHYGRSAPATAISMLIEDALALVGVLVLGVGDWRWLRPAALVTLVGLALAVTTVLVVLRLGRLPRRLAWLARYPRLRVALEEGGRFREAALLLARPRLLALQAALGAVYLALAGAGLYMIVQGLGVSSISFEQALAVYAFSLAIGLLAPLPLDLGVIEVSGVAALVAFGVGPDVAVSAMLLQRALSIAAAVLIGGGAMLVFRGELRAALGGWRGAPAVPHASEVTGVRTDAMAPRS